MLTKLFHTRRLAITALAVIVMAAMFLSACSSSKPEAPSNPSSETNNSGGANTPKDSPEPEKEAVDGGEITTAYLSEPKGFIRFWATDVYSSEVIELVFSSLYRFNEKQDIVPDLAEGEPQFSEDKKVMTIKIRNDAKFSDGQPVTADDVVFTYNIPINPEHVSPRKGTFDAIEKVEKVDDTTIKFTFKEPYAGYIDTLIYNIMPQHLLKDASVKDMDKSDFYKNPVGSGPFKLQEWKSGQYLTFVRNENYYGKAGLDKVTIKIIPDANAMMAQLQTGEINVVDVPADNLAVIEDYASKNPDKLKLQKGITSSAYIYAGWNLANPLFQDKNVRKALTMAIDRQAIVDSVAEGQGELIHSQTTPSYWNYTDDVPKFDYNVEQAKKLLEEAGWKDTDGDGILDKDGKKFEFEMRTNQGNKVREQVMTVVQQQLKEVGISVIPQTMEGSAFINEFLAKNFTSVIFGWDISGDPNPKGIWHSSEIESGMNTISYSNPEVDKLIEEDLQTFDKDKRKELLGKIDALIAEDQPYTFIYSPTRTMAYPANLEGFNPERSGLREVDKWHFTK
ncbi:peptide-binding protein [Paenibacillus sp. GCM10027626]|uniref:peptide-binding protein n=1 Tax=Paenibacillus sp. GCM10027626 TaxID=3273411 RepID=UPI003626BA42